MMHIIPFGFWASVNPTYITSKNDARVNSVMNLAHLDLPAQEGHRSNEWKGEHETLLVVPPRDGLFCLGMNLNSASMSFSEFDLRICSICLLRKTVTQFHFISVLCYYR